MQQTEYALEELASNHAGNGSGSAPKALVVANPYATTVSDSLRNLVVYALRGRFNVDSVETEKKGHAIELAREAAREDFDLVVAFGGDGTVNEAANGLAGSKTALTCLPGGATNVYCRLLDIPVDIVDATEQLLKKADALQTRRVSLGRAGDRLFCFCAGIGIDADVVELVDAHPRLKSRFGAWYYTSAATRTFMRRYLIKPPRMVVSSGGEEIECVSFLAQKGDPYSYFRDRPLHITTPETLASPTLSAITLGRASPIDMPFVASRVLIERLVVSNHKHVTSLDGLTQATVRSADDRRISLQVDGDNIGQFSEIELGVKPNALSIVA